MKYLTSNYMPEAVIVVAKEMAWLTVPLLLVLGTAVIIKWLNRPSQLSDLQLEAAFMHALYEDAKRLAELPLTEVWFELRKNLEHQLEIERDYDMFPYLPYDEIRAELERLSKVIELSRTSSDKLKAIERAYNALETLQHLPQGLREPTQASIKTAMLTLLAHENLSLGSELLLQSISSSNEGIDFQRVAESAEQIDEAIRDTPVSFPEATYELIKRIFSELQQYIEGDPLAERKLLRTSSIPQAKKEYKVKQLKRRLRSSLNSLLLTVQRWEEEAGAAVTNQRFYPGTGDWSDEDVKWVGNDLKECLQIVRESRSKF